MQYYCGKIKICYYFAPASVIIVTMIVFTISTISSPMDDNRVFPRKHDKSVLRSQFRMCHIPDNVDVYTTNTDPPFYITTKAHRLLDRVIGNRSIDAVSEQIMNTGQLDYGTTSFLWNSFIVPPENRGNRVPPLFVDVGAGLGFYTLYAAALGAEVISIEPEWEKFRLINISLCLNYEHRISGRVVVFSEYIRTDGTGALLDNLGLDRRIDVLRIGNDISNHTAVEGVVLSGKQTWDITGVPASIIFPIRSVENIYFWKQFTSKQNCGLDISLSAGAVLEGVRGFFVNFNNYTRVHMQWDVMLFLFSKVPEDWWNSQVVRCFTGGFY